MKRKMFPKNEIQTYIIFLKSLNEKSKKKNNIKIMKMKKVL